MYGNVADELSVGMHIYQRVGRVRDSHSLVSQEHLSLLDIFLALYRGTKYTPCTLAIINQLENCLKEVTNLAQSHVNTPKPA